LSGKMHGQSLARIFVGAGLEPWGTCA
jgi:hypothetical protein